MKKNWKNRYGSIWMCVIIFLFMGGTPQIASAQKDSIIFSKTTWKKQLKDMTKYHFFRQDTRDEVLNFTLRYLAKCEDMAIKKEGVGILDALPATTIREKKKPMYEATRNILLGNNKK